MSQYVRAKKHLGQHFLKDENIAADIVAALPKYQALHHVIEVGPGMGVLTKYLIVLPNINLKVAEGDTVKAGDQLLILEAMKMENILKSPGDGVVKKIKVKKGDSVEKNQVLIEF